MKRIILFAALSALMVACSSEELIIEDISQNGDKALNIKTDIQSTIDTKAIKLGQEFTDGDEICVRMAPITPADGIFQKWPTYYRYSGADGKWNFFKQGSNSAPKIYLDSSEHSFISFYPAPKVVDGKNDIEVLSFKEMNANIAVFDQGCGIDNTKLGLRFSHPAVANSLDASDQKDIMIGLPYNPSNPSVQPTASKSNATVGIRFYHQFSKIEVIVNKSEDYSPTGAITEVMLTDSKSSFYEMTNSEVDGSVLRIPTDSKICTFDNLKTVLDKTVGFKSSTPVNANAYASTASTNVVVKGLIIPRDATENGVLTFKIKIDGRFYTADIPYDLLAVTGFKGSFKPATNYRFTFTVYPDAIRLMNVTIADWGEGGRNIDPVILN